MSRLSLRYSLATAVPVGLVGWFAIALPAAAQSADDGPPTDTAPSTVEQVLFIGLVLVVCGLISLFVVRRTRAASRSASHAIRSASRLSNRQLTAARLRFEQRGGTEGRFVQLFVYDRLARNVHTYRAAYELMVRGIRAKLYAESPSGEMRLGKKMRQMDLENASVFTTADVADQLEDITSIGEFAKRMPFRKREHLALVVHEEDLDEAYEVIADQGLVRVGVVAPPTPDVTWQDA